MRAAQTIGALALLTVLAGCGTEHGNSPRDGIPSGPENGTATIHPGLDNSGPHQFPLDVHTTPVFYPDKTKPVQVHVSDDKVVIVVPGGRAAPTNSGPHQNPGGNN